MTTFITRKENYLSKKLWNKQKIWEYGLLLNQPMMMEMVKRKSSTLEYTNTAEIELVFQEEFYRFVMSSGTS